MNLKKKACIAIILALAVKKKRPKRKRWLKNWMEKRHKLSHFNLISELRLSNDDFKNYFRMKANSYDKLLAMVRPFLKKQDTHMRQAITPEEKLALTLRFLATGRSFEDLKFSVIRSARAISTVIMDTCEALVYVLQDYIKIQSTPEEWKKIADEFGHKYQFWNCTGALDGKHISIKQPSHSGARYFNYKGFYSIILLALANAKREFLMVDVRMNGRISDGGVLFYSKFWTRYERGDLHLPNPTALPNTTQIFPFVFVADEAFALGPNLMKPFGQKNCSPDEQTFNYQLSRARSTIECTFGILANRFGFFQKPMNLDPGKATKITLGCCYLHNFLIKESESTYLQRNEDLTNDCLMNLQATLSRNAGTDAKLIRENVCSYFCNEGNI